MFWAETMVRVPAVHDKTAAEPRREVSPAIFMMSELGAPDVELTRGMEVSGRTRGLPPGSRVGDYVLKDVIARGGFGAVYRAEHVGSGASVAIKVLHPELVLTREAVVRFEREIQAIRRIDHPNVIHILDFGELDGGRPYFAMELLKGMDLGAYMRACGRLSPEETFAILEPVCEALSAVPSTVVTAYQG